LRDEKQLSMNLGVVLVCAGKGLRLGKNKDKAFVKVCGRPMYLWSLDLFSSLPEVKQIAVVADEKHHPLLKQYQSRKKIIPVRGGRRRQDSVLQGLKVFTDSIDKVIIHDGARPLLSRKLAGKLIRALSGNLSVICGLPQKEALKKVKSGFVRETVKREEFWAIQTPQGFDRKLLTEAFKKFKRRSVYDEAQLMEFAGIKTKIIEGDLFNIKITYPEDLKLAELLLKRDKHR